MRHKDITNKAILETSVALLAHAKKLYNLIVDTDSQIQDSSDDLLPNQAYSLLRRLKYFGIDGVISEGELSDLEFEEIFALQQLEKITPYEHDGLVDTIAQAANGRLTLAISEGFDLHNIYLDGVNPPSDGAYISLDELSALANVSLASVRNAISADSDSLKAVKHAGINYIDAKKASTWLECRNEFKPTRYVNGVIEDSSVLSAPVASDGSIFDCSCALKRGGFKVGEKGNEQKFEVYEDALKYLSHMVLAKWRRPNKSGNYGIVSAVRWEYFGVEKLFKN
jgi:hypothetical protein